MSERGEYRAFLRVLWDGKDFQCLPERARWVFVTLKAALGPSGIEVAYRGALVIELAMKTGAPAEAVNEALDVLEQEKWICIQGNVVWVVKQLQYDPHMKVKNANHRASIQQHIRGLPRLRIVQEFIAFYPEWFADAPDLLNAIPNAMPHAIGDTIDITRPMTDDITEDITITDYKDKTDDDSRTPVRACEEGPAPATPPANGVGPANDVERSVDGVMIAANQGMKVRFGEAYNPIPLGHASRQSVHDWLNAGIPAELAASTVFESASKYQPTPRHRQINTMKYFDDAVREAFDKQRPGPAMPRNGKRAPQKYDYSNATTEFKGLKT